MATFVLVHGTGHGGWCWKHVARHLRSAGHEVYTPTLTGNGERSHLLTAEVNLTTHITDVVNVLRYDDLREVALVGHSYAGMVVEGVAGQVPERLATLIYLDSYIPAPGESWFDLQPPGLADAVRAEAAGAPFRQAGSPESLGVTDPATSAWMRERLGPHPLAAYAEPLPPAPDKQALLGRFRRAYVHCTAGQSVVRFARFARLAEQRGWPVRYLATGHDGMLTVPEELARVLDELAG